MKKIMLLLLPVFVMSCNKSETSDNAVTAATGNNTNSNTVTLTAEDVTTTNAIRSELMQMQQMLDSMLATPHLVHQRHWDSLYHHHDSLLWHHHNLFHYDTYTHDDHHHSWTSYDPHIDHTHHYHHHFPGHINDSLVTVHGNHSHDNVDHHYNGHDIHDHFLADSLHHVHSLHHP